jgi:hypothetical protein
MKCYDGEEGQNHKYIRDVNTRLYNFTRQRSETQIRLKIVEMLVQRQTQQSKEAFVCTDEYFPACRS